MSCGVAFLSNSRVLTVIILIPGKLTSLYLHVCAFLFYFVEGVVHSSLVGGTQFMSSDEGLEVKGTDIDVVGQGARDETDAAGKGSASQLRSINNPN